MCLFLNLGNWTRRSTNVCKNEVVVSPAPCINTVPSPLRKTSDKCVIRLNHVSYRRFSLLRPHSSARARRVSTHDPLKSPRLFLSSSSVKSPIYRSSVTCFASRHKPFQLAPIHSGTYLRIGNKSKAGCSVGSKIRSIRRWLSLNTVTSFVEYRGARFPNKIESAIEVVKRRMSV